MNRNWYLISTTNEDDIFQEWIHEFVKNIAQYVARLWLGVSLKKTEKEMIQKLPPTNQSIRFYRYPMIGEDSVKFSGWIQSKDEIIYLKNDID
jgi:hypothetical protein